MKLLARSLSAWLLFAGASFAALEDHFPLSDNAANTTVDNIVSTDGALEGGDNTSAKATTGPNAVVTAAFDLNGTDDAINITGTSPSYASGTAWTVAAWVKFDATTGTWIGRSNNNTNRIFKGSDTAIGVIGSSGTNSFAVPSLGTTNWHYIVITHDTSNNLRCYAAAAGAPSITESSTGAIAMAQTFAPTYIGRQSSAFFDGKIASVRFYNSLEDPAALYAAETASARARLQLLMRKRRQ